MSLLIKDPKALSREELLALLVKLEDSYYNEGESLVPDSVYDELAVLYGSRRDTVGAPIRNMEHKRVLARPMPSLDKIKEDRALNLWKARNPPPYVVSEKVDGISIQQHQRQLSTRGDGMIGGTIDHLLPHLSVPKDVGADFVRAEIVMPISIFKERYQNEFANPRNMTGGLANPSSTSYKIEAVEALRVLAYELTTDSPLRQSEQLVKLQKRGYATPRYSLYASSEDLTIESLKTLLTQWRTEADYEMDGLVVTSDHLQAPPTDVSLPSYAMAFKVAGESKRTVVKEVVWEVSKHGLLKPRVHFEPISLDGVTIMWATGHNAKFIVSNNIGVGAELEIERSGSVIPYIKGIHLSSPSGAQMPSVPYTWLRRKRMELAGSVVRENATVEEIDGKTYTIWHEESDVDICTIDETPEQRVKVLVEFFQKLKAKHVGEATVLKLFNAGYDTLQKIFNLKVSDVVELPGFQEKGATRIVEAIHGAIASVPLARVAGASGVFGMGFGERKLANVLQKIPNLLELELPFEELCELLHTAGLQATAPQFAKCLPAFKSWLREHQEIKLGGVLSAPSSAVSATDATDTTSAAGSPVGKPTLDGESLVFSGFRDAALEAAVVGRGGRVCTGVSGKTTILVVKKLGAGKSKEQKALEMGIKVLELTTFSQQYGL